MIYLKEATASQEIPLGYFLDSTDGDTEETGLTIANTDIKIWKTGATTLANKNSGGATHISNGIYYTVLDATDTDTLGSIKIHVHVAGALVVIQECIVLSANVYDSWIAGTDFLEVDTMAISGDATAADNLESTYDGTGYDNAVAPAQQQQVTNLTVGSSGISTTATTAVVTTGSQTNTYTSTHELDSVYHLIQDDAGTTDLYYQFNVSPTGVPSAVTLTGRINGLNDDINIFGYNWGTTSWEQIGEIIGKTQSTDDEINFALYNTHVGTGANAGLVRVRFQNTGLGSSSLYIDQLFVSYAIVASPVGYANGQIWVDTINGTAGTATNVNGVADNPVDSWADALTISGNTGLLNFNIGNGSSITLSANSDYYTLIGANWSLDLNGQSIANVSISGAEVVGICTGTDYEMFNCKLGNGTGVTVDAGFFLGCAISGDITLTGAGTYYFDQCFSGVAGTATPSIDFGAGVANTNVNFRHYSGGIEVQNIGQAGTDSMSLEGWGQYVLNANCVGGTIAVRGHFKKTDNSGNAVTISDDANFKTNVIHFGIAQGAGTGNNQIQLATTASATNGAYDPAEVFIVSGTGAGQTRLILEYDGATKTATVDRNWKANPDSTSEYRVSAHPGREHVNEGLAQAGANSTITLNTLASADDDAYNNQIVFVRSGTGEDQVRRITDYVGSSKIATVDNNWDTNPDSTSGYVILPTQVHNDNSTNVSAIKTKTDQLTFTTANKLDSRTDYVGTNAVTTPDDFKADLTSLNDITVAEIIAGITDGTYDLQEMLRIMFAVLSSKSSGGGTNTLLFRDSGDSKNRVSATVDANGNRTGVTLNAT